MSRWLLTLVRAAVVLLAVPAAALAQASITGQVRDASGAVLPGVTVEATSPALIEKVRTAVTDSTGQYRLELLPPGAYAVRFTLPGFSVVQRAGVQLSGTFTATIDAELVVGALEETIVVTGETPVVDVQSATRQQVVDRELIDALPTSRTPFALTQLIPGVTGGQDFGGTRNLTGATQMQVHGSTGNSTMIMENGLSTAALVGAWGSQLAFNMAAVQEVAVDYSGAAADTNAAGVKMNVIPREGGNAFNGTLFMSGTTEALQGDNFSQELRDAGLRSPDAIRKMYDINPGYGGPLQRDRLWFYVAGRLARSSNWAANEFYDSNANNPAAWLYQPDLSRPVSNDADLNDVRGRLTFQATPTVKIAGSYQQQTAENFPTIRDASGRGAGATLSAVEASPRHYFPVQRQVMLDLTSPITNRLLIDGAIMHKVERAIRDRFPGLNPAMIPVVEQSTGREYRARSQYINRPSYQYVYRGSVSYITGAHALKFGFGDITGYFNQHDYDNAPVTYRFNNGVPNQITMRALPVIFRVDVDHQWGAYVQDRWTVDRLTVNAGLRWDWFKNSFPAQTVGPATLAPNRSFEFPDTDNLSLHDLNPKLGVAYDVFGDGRTAIKAGLNRYVEQYTVNGIAGSRNPINRLANSTTRSWNDSNRNYVPDCSLQVLTANGECGAVANQNFGSATPEVNFDPDLLTGWGKRDYNWEFSAGLQREIIARVSADVSYYRRWYGNQTITDNQAVTAADFDPFSITAPSDPRLPDGGGYALSGLYNVKPEKFGQTRNFITFADSFGALIREYNGFAVTMNARLQNGITLLGGVDWGTTTTDNCEIRQTLPEIDPVNPFCRTEVPNTQVKLSGSYTVPRVDVLVSGSFQSSDGPQILANYTATNAAIVPSLGRPLSGGAANVSVNLVEPGSMFGERLNQLDLRFSKILRFGDIRTMLSLDLYNALNADTVLTVNNAYASWQRPTSFVLARFAKFGLQFDF